MKASSCRDNRETLSSGTVLSVSEHISEAGAQLIAARLAPTQTRPFGSAMKKEEGRLGPKPVDATVTTQTESLIRHLWRADGGHSGAAPGLAQGIIAEAVSEGGGRGLRSRVLHHQEAGQAHQIHGTDGPSGPKALPAWDGPCIGSKSRTVARCGGKLLSIEHTHGCLETPASPPAS